MSVEEQRKQIDWLHHKDVRAFLASGDIETPWFSAYRRVLTDEHRITWFSALVPPALVPELVGKSSNWDLRIGDGGPCVTPVDELNQWAHIDFWPG
jgi:hypothetical protein